MASMIRYADSFEFDGRSDEYLRETFDLWAKGDTNEDWAELYRYGCLAIIEECHTRALVMNVRFTRSYNSFIGGVNNGYAIVMRHNLRAPHWMRNCRTDKAYTETMELGHRVMSSFDSRIH